MTSTDRRGGIRRVPVAVLTAALATLAAGTASAQPIFVTGAAFANVFRAGGFSSNSPVIDNPDISGTTTGGAIGVGARLARHVVVQMEIALPGPIERDFDPPEYRQPLRPIVTINRRVEYRTRHGSILGGYQTGETHRVSAAILGGVMFLQEKVRTVTSLSYLPPIVPPFPPVEPSSSDSTQRAYRLAPVFGLDVAIAATAHLAVVPQMRVHKTTGPGSVGALGLWPGIGVRWTF